MAPVCYMIIHYITELFILMHLCVSSTLLLEQLKVEIIFDTLGQLIKHNLSTHCIAANYTCQINAVE